jgi:hypothetical protein
LSANDVSKGTMILSSLHVPFAELKLFGFGRILHLTYFYVNHVKTKRRKKIFSPDIIFLLDASFFIFPNDSNLKTAHLFFISRTSSAWDTINQSLFPALQEKAIIEIR